MSHSQPSPDNRGTVHRRKTLAQRRTKPPGYPRSLCGETGTVTPLTRKVTCKNCRTLIKVLDRGRSMMLDTIPTPAALLSRT